MPSIQRSSLPAAVTACRPASGFPADIEPRSTVSPCARPSRPRALSWRTLFKRPSCTYARRARTFLSGPLLALGLVLAPFAGGLAIPCGAQAQRATLLVPSKPTVEPSLPVTSTRDAVRGLETGKGQKADAAKNQTGKANATKKGTRQANATGAAEGKADANAAAKGNGANAPRGVMAQASDGALAVSLPELVDGVNASIAASIAPQHIKEEVDLLIAGMEPFRHHGVAMDPPRIFTIYRFDRDLKDPRRPARREDRLGDIEEIRYLDQKAWGANVGLDRPGLYQFAMETQPWWSTSHAGYAQHLVKVMVPVYGEEWGWDLPLNLSFEIVPRTRPFGLQAPSLFSGRVLVDGKPVAGTPVHVFRVNTENVRVPTPWHESLETLTDENGNFEVVLNRPGWWGCEASREAEPLKGPDGQPSPLRVSTLFWLYVDALDDNR